jgi:hypothetical protein
LRVVWNAHLLTVHLAYPPDAVNSVAVFKEGVVARLVADKQEDEHTAGDAHRKPGHVDN